MHGKEGETKALALQMSKKGIENNFIKIIDVESKEELKSIPVKKEDQNICDLAITLDNKKIICGGQKTTKIVCIDVETEVVKFIETSHTLSPGWC